MSTATTLILGVACYAGVGLLAMHWIGRHIRTVRQTTSVPAHENDNLPPPPRAA